MTFEQIRGWFPGDYGGPTHEAARRKFERDKDDLIELGVPLKYEEPVDGESESEGGYRIDRASYYLRDLELTRDELALLYLAGAAVLEQDVFPYRRDLELALAKIALQAGVDRSSTASAFKQILVRHPATRTTPELRERLDQLEHAATTRKRVRILYETSYRGSTSERTVDPYGLFCARGRWSLVGFCHQRQAVRVFSLLRIQRLTPNTEKPKHPDFEVAAGFELRDHVAVPAWKFELHPPMEVVVEAEPEVAFLVERHLGVTREPGGDGAYRFRVETTHVDALLDWALGLHGRVRLVSPPEVKAQATAVLRAVLARYEVRQ